MTTANVSTQNIDNLLKTTWAIIYPDIVARDHHVTGLAVKKSGTGASNMQVAKYAQGGARSHSFASAFGNVNPGPSRARFQSTWSWRYGFDLVKNTDLRMFREDRGKVYDLWTDALESAGRMVGDDTEFDLHQDGFAVRGTILSNTNPSGQTFVLTLKVAQQAILFEQNMQLVSCANTTGTALDAGTCTVTGVDQQGGTVTVLGDGTWSPTNTNLLFAIGDYDGSGNAQLTPGLKGWLPLAAPGLTDSWQGQNRSVSVVNLAGWRRTTSSGNLAQTVKDLANDISKNSRAKPDVCLLSVDNFGILETLVDNKTRYAMPAKTDAPFFYEGIKVSYAKGSLTCVADPFMTDQDRFYNLQTDTMMFYTPSNELIAPADDEDKFVTQYNADARQIRMVCQSQFQLTAPGFSGVGTTS